MRDTDLTKKLKEAMEYRGPERCCNTCVKHVPTDCSGNFDAKQEHCTLNPAADVPVEATGCCKFHQPKTTKPATRA